MIPVYRGRRRQRGYGLGGLFASLFRQAAPLLKQGAKVMGKQLLKTGVAVAKDVVQGRNLKTSLKKRGVEGVKLVGKKALRKVKQQIFHKRPPPDRMDLITPKSKRRRRHTQKDRDIFS